MMQISIEENRFSVLLNQREIKMKRKNTINKIHDLALSFDFVSLLPWLCWIQQPHCLQGYLPTCTIWNRMTKKVSAIDEWGLWINLGRAQSCFSISRGAWRNRGLCSGVSVIAMDTTRIDPLSRGPTNTNAHTAKWKRSCSSWTHPLNPRSLAIHPAK